MKKKVINFFGELSSYAKIKVYANQVDKVKRMLNELSQHKKEMGLEILPNYSDEEIYF